MRSTGGVRQLVQSVNIWLDVVISLHRMLYMAKVITVRIDDETRQMIEQIAAQHGLTISSVVCLLLGDSLEEYKDDHQEHEETQTGATGDDEQAQE